LHEPRVDPHGQLIPGRNGQVPPRSAIPLTELAAGRRAVVVEVPDGDPQRLRYLGALGLVPGRSLCTVGWAGDLLAFDLDGQVRRLERGLAALILVREINEP
jgi:DtxR family Mn-dependent transcriptional regulator